MEPVVVRVLFDVLGVAVVLLAGGGDVPQPCRRPVPRVARAGEAGERDEGTLDAVTGDRVVRGEVATFACTGGREHDRADDTGLAHLSFDGLRRDGTTTRRRVLVRVELDVHVDDAKPMFQLQHRRTVRPPRISRYRSTKPRSTNRYST